MLGEQYTPRKKSSGDAEKPFWISFADLMTALMMLFLVVMSVALLSVTKTVSEAELAKTRREQAIELLMNKMAQAAERYPGVTVDRSRNSIDFGDRARFDTASHHLNIEQAKLLRAFIPEVLAIAREDMAKHWIKHVVVEGFTDQRGSYLYNLNLSLQRSQRVLCVLLATPLPDEKVMIPSELEQIRELFLVGGYSSNSAKQSFDESRRIELRLEFFGVNERETATTENAPRVNFGQCALGQ